MESNERPWHLRLLNYAMFVGILVAITAAGVAGVCWLVGSLTPLFYSKALFGSGFIVMLLGVGRFFRESTSYAQVPGGVGWIHNPAQYTAQFWRDIDNGYSLVIFTFISGVVVSTIGWLLLSQVAPCPWCMLF